MGIALTSYAKLPTAWGSDDEVIPILPVAKTAADAVAHILAGAADGGVRVDGHGSSGHDGSEGGSASAPAIHQFAVKTRFSHWSSPFAAGALTRSAPRVLRVHDYRMLPMAPWLRHSSSCATRGE